MGAGLVGFCRWASTSFGQACEGSRPHSHDRDDYSTHLLGHWVREEQVMSLEEAVYRLTGKTALMHDLPDHVRVRREDERRHRLSFSA